MTEKEKLALLKEIQEMDLTASEQMLTGEETRQQYEARKGIIEKKIMHIGTLETINANWVQCIQQGFANKGFANKGFLLCEEKESDKSNLRRNKEQPTQIIPYPTVNLPQLPLSTLSSNPKMWRGYWSSFEAAVHLQKIPDIQKLDYLIARLKEDALLIINKSLYNELYSVKKNDREWKVKVKVTERIIRQLEAMGENLEQSSIEIIIENKLPLRILDRVTKNATTERKQLIVYLNCLQPGHTTINCKTRKHVCFYCKVHHNTILCCTKYNDQAQSVEPIEEDRKTTKNDECLFLKYNETIRDQLQPDIIEKVCAEMSQVGIIHYPPHHEVITPNKAMTKIRIVYDALLHQKGEKSLKDLELLPTERNCTRFFWLKDKITEDNIEHYRFKRVPFEVIPLPFLLSATLNCHLENYDNELANEIRKNLYVDNIIVLTTCIDEALHKYQEMKNIFNNASMNVREFLSNNKEFNSKIPEQDQDF
ncbi:unnamed protein product [Brugia pahangi]|uniref:DUF1758 domain-containing protein n=1 Tax=Brugia pahangi TaxID=6280 RepID=A0A0N4T2Q1_BRUPA|nr:unnamed protein product [Brugia pahangi]